MSLKKYLSAIAGTGAVSETALYTSLATHILSGVLGYESKLYAINKAGAKGIPDIRIYSGEDKSEWIVCEAKLDDDDIRKEAKRQRIWKEQVVQRGYIRAETFYVLLCAPRTFYVCNLDGEVLDGVHIEGDELIEIKSATRLPVDDANLRRLLERITHRASLERPQYELFRQGKLPGGYLPLTAETVGDLQDTFDFALRHLKTYCAQVFEQLKQEHRDATGQLRQLEKRYEDVGSDQKLQRAVLSRSRRLKKKHRLVLQLFDVDYPQFKHDQTYAGTEKEEHFEDIFVTNTAYVALSRLFFVRICEDIGLTTRKISHEGPSLWRRFVEHIKWRYQDLVEVAYKDVAHVYSQLFEETVFDWYGHGNGQLNDILERILFRLNAFSFKDVSRDVLGRIYQYFRPKAERKRLGEYYTAEEAVDYILAQTGIAGDSEIMSRRILDPSCGSFTFGVRALAPLLKAGAHLSAENRIELVQRCLIGYDINPFSVFLSHLSLLFATLDIYLEAKRRNPQYVIPGFNIHNRNSLTYFSQTEELQRIGEETEEQHEEQADYVIGNPPFVRNERLPADDREVLDQLFAAIKTGNTDLSAYFLYYAMRYWLKDGGVLGMVAPIGIANTKMAEQLRAQLRGYALFQIVSLEWMAKEIFPDADIIPMLLFARKERPAEGHKVTVVAGLRNKPELRRAAEDAAFFNEHASALDYQQWLELSPTGDWPLEVKAADTPILEKLNGKPKLGKVASASLGITISGARITRPYKQSDKKESEVPLIKGHHICAFSSPGLNEMSETDELVDLSKISEARSASIWRDLTFYQEHQGQADESGLGRADYNGRGLLNDHPSDVLCCFAPTIYVTMIAGVGNPLDVCANDSAVVVTPYKFSAHVIAAIINSRVARYYAFMLLRSAILLRRRAHWYPRTIENLPLPDLQDAQAKQLHQLAKEAAQLSQGVHLNELDAYSSLMADSRKLDKAGFLGVRWSGEGAVIDRDDLTASRVENAALKIGSLIVSGEEATLHLLRLALLALDQEEIAAEAIQDVLLPSEEAERVRIASEITGLARKLEQTKARMEGICEEIDEVVAAASGLTPREHEIIRQRCQQFPLSVTVERPRYVWSPDRKRQARRIYQPGERFKK
jgi:type I restriction-modification system DNA methylase subunit